MADPNSQPGQPHDPVEAEAAVLSVADRSRASWTKSVPSIIFHPSLQRGVMASGRLGLLLGPRSMNLFETLNFFHFIICLGLASLIPVSVPSSLPYVHLANDIIFKASRATCPSSSSPPSPHAPAAPPSAGRPCGSSPSASPPPPR
jgi:hypothetical protein